MSKLLIMTDLHLTAGPRIIDLDPAERFRAGLEHAARYHSDADRLILLGDLTHDGTDAQYAELAGLLDTLPWPVTPLLGNHDARAAYQSAIPTPHEDGPGFVQSIVDLPEARVICLDTLDENAAPLHAGLLCEERLDWLQNALATAQGSVIVCMHHPPYNTGFAGMDRIKLANADTFWRVIGAHRVDHILCGHIHRTITATIRGVPVTTFKSTCHQMPMALGDAGHSSSLDEPGAFGIVLLNGPDIVVHF